MDIKQLEAVPPWEWPEETRDALIHLLGDSSADIGDRRLAVSMAGDLSILDDTLAKGLLVVLADEGADSALRGWAAIALGPALENADLMGFDDEEDNAISEKMFQAIQDALEKCYRDGGCPKVVRRRALEASVRCPQKWHEAAIRSAYLSKDPEWRLTAVFGMRYIDGFEPQILESLEDSDQDIHYEAVCAAGSLEVRKAWPHIASLLTDEETDKGLLLAAIDAAVGIRPEDAAVVLGPLLESDDEDIVDAVHESLAMIDALEDFEFEDGDEFY